jgi:hypothetical protein
VRFGFYDRDVRTTVLLFCHIGSQEKRKENDHRKKDDSSSFYRETDGMWQAKWRTLSCAAVGED